MQNNKLEINLPNGLTYKPITDDLAERCAEIAAQSFVTSNPLTIAIGKTFEEEKQRFLVNMKNHQNDPFTHVLMDGDEIIHVNLCCRWDKFYLGVVAEEGFSLENRGYTEKQKFVLGCMQKLYNKDVFGDHDYLASVYCKNPRYTKQTDCLQLRSQIFHYMIAFYGGIEEISLCTNKKMERIMIKLTDAIAHSELNVNELYFQGKKAFEGIKNAHLSLMTFGFLEPQSVLPEYKYLVPLVFDFCSKQGFKPNYYSKPHLRQKSLQVLEQGIRQMEDKNQKISPKIYNQYIFLSTQYQQYLQQKQIQENNNVQMIPRL